MTALLCQRLGVELPIIQAPMAGSQGSALAIAVSNAGGVGSLPCALLDIEGVRRELGAIRSGTSRPYNVNFFCHVPPAADAARERAWRDALAPYYREYGIDLRAIPAGPGRHPFSAEMADAIEAFEPPIVSFHFGLPSAELLRRVRRWGAVVLSSATTVDEARWLEAHGADVVIAQGLEAGGHRGHFLSDDLTMQTDTAALVRQIVRAVRVPVIAAGGIADAHGVKAMLALGASGVQVGTAYLLCPEATTSQVHREAIAAAPQTAVTNLFTGRPARGAVNRLMREIGPMSPIAPSFPLASAAISPLRAAAEAAGRSDFSPLWMGQHASGCREIAAAELTRELIGKGIVAPAPTIRRAGLHDVSRVTQLVNHAFEVEAFFAVGDRTSEAQVRAKLDVGVFFLAELRDRLVGCVHAEPRENGRGDISMLAVDPTHQRFGVGRELMRVAERHCLDARCTEVLITVINLRTELRPFYERLGYVEHGTAPYSDTHRATQPVHFIVMRKSLG